MKLIAHKLLFILTDENQFVRIQKFSEVDALYAFI